MPNPLWTHDRKASKGRAGIVGVDEAGRGCLAGPVVAGAMLLPTGFFKKASNRRRCVEVNDSKQLNEEQREKLFKTIERLRDLGELWFTTGEATVNEIESENIVGATCIAMRRAMDALGDKCEGRWGPQDKDEAEGFFASEIEQSERWIVLVDGKPMKRLPHAHEGLVKGDTLSLGVAMASIAAKVTRDRIMRKLDQSYPAYDFASNKGYGSPNHLRGLDEHGPTEVHRPRFLEKILPPTDETKAAQTLLSFS
uniref:Ribonuclease HII n=1 Tax=uncultured marine microorganism HF4000_APKG3D20 TaxID=455549 RepID=B3T7B1_9ZZZZ|nr:putative Ribonuclease HII [uncultured marine microorganism HF4000_APKG3D20]